MPAAPTRPALRERYDRRQQAVVDRAAETFAASGFQTTSMADLTEATGLTVGGLYHYVGSKDELLFLVCDGVMQPLLDRARAIEADESATAPEQLRALLLEWVDHVVKRRHSLLVFHQERHLIERERRWRQIRSARKEFELILDRILARGQADGDFAFEDRVTVLLALLGMVNHIPQWYRPSGRLTPEQIAAGYFELAAGAGAGAATAS